MRRLAAAFASLLLAVLALPSSAQQQPLTLRQGDIALVGGSLFDATGDALRPNPGILIRNGVILRIGLTPEETRGARQEDSHAGGTVSAPSLAGFLGVP